MFIQGTKRVSEEERSGIDAKLHFEAQKVRAEGSLIAEEQAEIP
jgi:hypothetical protein